MNNEIIIFIFQHFVLIEIVQNREKTTTFYLFTYANDMVQSTLQAVAPSAEFYCIGELDDASISSGYYSDEHESCVYTYEPVVGQSVWGVIWKVAVHDIYALDKRGPTVDEEYVYEEVEVEILTKDGSIVKCVAYQFKLIPGPQCNPGICPPSTCYRDVTANAAIEYGFPKQYVKSLQSIRST